jgi:hypothetical protein
MRGRGKNEGRGQIPSFERGGKTFRVQLHNIKAYWDETHTCRSLPMYLVAVQL